MKTVKEKNPCGAFFCKYRFCFFLCGGSHVQSSLLPWYTVILEPSMRVTLRALMRAGGNGHEHIQDTPPLALSFFISVIGTTTVTVLAGIQWILLCVGSTRLCLSICCQTVPVICVLPCHQTSSDHLDKLIAQSSLSMLHCPLRLCTRLGKDGRRSC